MIQQTLAICWVYVLEKVLLNEFLAGNVLPMTQCYEKLSFFPFLSNDGIEHQSSFEKL